MQTSQTEGATTVPGDSGALDQATKDLRNGPIGALTVSSIAAAILFIGWMAFYFLLFIPRGPIG